MGRGNSLIRDKNGTTYPTYYIDYYRHDDEINEETDEPYCDNNPCICNETFMDDLLSNITYSITPKQKGLYGCYGGKMKYTHRHNQAIYFENNVFQVIMEDNESSIAIGCIPILNDNDKYNYYIFSRSANKFMKLLSEIYELSVRTSAWTSGKVDKDKPNFY